MKELNYIRVVLVEPTHPGNIGAAARAMGNMGVEQLVLVNPSEFPSPVASARASGADWILENARVCTSLDEALEDCTLVFGTTARMRSIEWPSLDPWSAMENARDRIKDTPVAIVFGRESSGLKNEEMDRCHHLVRIPVNDVFSSLNLGSAVTVMLYELRKGMIVAEQEIDQHSTTDNNLSKPVAKKSRQEFASTGDMQGFYAHMEDVLHKIDFFDGRSTKLMRKLIRLFNRAQPSREEINIMRGILAAVEYREKCRSDSSSSLNSR